MCTYFLKDFFDKFLINKVFLIDLFNQQSIKATTFLGQNRLETSRTKPSTPDAVYCHTYDSLVYRGLCRSILRHAVKMEKKEHWNQIIAISNEYLTTMELESLTGGRQGVFIQSLCHEQNATQVQSSNGIKLLLIQIFSFPRFVA